MRKTHLSERFCSKVDIGRPDECWNWVAGLTSTGYGQIDTKKAPRVAYEFHYGEIPEGKHVLHRCDNPKCVNPLHLFAGSHQENMADRDKKGRQITPLGSKHGRSKLTEDEVLAIRGDNRTGRAIAAGYNICESTVSSIKARTTWVHI